MQTSLLTHLLRDEKVQTNTRILLPWDNSRDERHTCLRRRHHLCSAFVEQWCRRLQMIGCKKSWCSGNAFSQTINSTRLLNFKCKLSLQKQKIFKKILKMKRGGKKRYLKIKIKESTKRKPPIENKFERKCQKKKKKICSLWIVLQTKIRKILSLHASSEISIYKGSLSSCFSANTTGIF